MPNPDAAPATQESPQPGRRWWGVAPPRALVLLLGVVALMGASWALLVPAFQVPDEDVHFAYVETLVEHGRLPGGQGAALSSAQLEAMRALNTDAVVFSAASRPEWSRAAYEAYQRRSADVSDQDGGGPNTASSYPPAYYGLASVGYRLAGGAGVLAHLYATRLFSVLFLLVTTTAVWLLAGELLGRNRQLQLLAAAVVGLWPMVDFMSAGVNPDSLLYATWSLALWLGVRVLRRGLDPRAGAALGLVTGVALITKAPSVALIPAVAFVVTVAALRVGRRQPRTAILGTLALLVALAVPVEAWRLTIASLDRPAYTQVSGAVSSGLNVREFLSYVWQYYLPTLPWQQRLRFDTAYVSSYPALNVWVASSWAAFGWVTVFFPLWLYKVFLAITALFGGAALIAGLQRLWRRRRSPGHLRTWLPVLGFLALAAGALVLGFHLAEYRVKGPTNQGRYLFPLVGIGGCAVALSLTLLPLRARRAACGVVLGSLVVYQVACLGFVAAHYYA